MSEQFYDEGEPCAEGSRKVLLATPSYDAPCAAYTFSIARSREALTTAGIQSAYLLLQGNCHVDDARNSIVRDFLDSDCTDLCFLDADIDWEPKQLVQLCQRDLDVVGGVYPYRREGGETMPCRFMSDRGIDDAGLIEVEGLPTGFLKIKRRVLERMAATAPKFFDKIYETPLVFDRPTPGADKTRWGGDIDFCNRWRALGGKIYADAELRLGHSGKIIVRDSLAANLRRIKRRTFGYIIPKFKAGTETEDDINELARYVGNPFAVDASTLALCVGLARKCAGPIMETGSGLSTVAMASVTTQPVYALEHLEFYAGQTLAWAREAEVDNVGLCCAPLTDDLWYDVDKFDLPRKFSLGFCDGPPRYYGTRMKFFDAFGERCTAILVDDIKTDNNFALKVNEWARLHGRTVQILGRCALILKAETLRRAA